MHAADVGIISVEQLRNLQKSVNREFIILDVGGEFSYNFEHIDGAINFPLEEIEKRCDELPSNKLIVVYCHCSGDATFAKMAAEKLFRIGFKQVVYLGIPQEAFYTYKKSGYPVSVSNRDMSIAMMSIVTSDKDNEYVGSSLCVSPEVLHTRIQKSSENYIVADLREQKYYIEGHIEGAINRPFSMLLNKDEKTGKYPFSTFPKNKEIFFYSDDELKSQIVVAVMVGQKYDLVYYLRNGLQEWQKMGYILVK